MEESRVAMLEASRGFGWYGYSKKGKDKKGKVGIERGIW
jgi:hypothetical protein